MTRPRGKREDDRVCIHEAAHIVACNKLFLFTPHAASVEPIGHSSGRVTELGAFGAEWSRALIHNNPNLKGMRAGRREVDEKNIIGLLAGLAAEHRRSRYSMDDAASFIFSCAGMLKYGFPSTDLQKTVDLLKVYEPHAVRRNKWLRELCGRTCEHVWEWWPEIQKVAAFLQERRTLDRDGIFEAYELIEAKEGTW